MGMENKKEREQRVYTNKDKKRHEKEGTEKKGKNFTLRSSSGPEGKTTQASTAQIQLWRPCRK